VASDLPKSPGHPFDTGPNRLLAENGFAPLIEKLCAPYSAETFVRLGVPPDGSSGGFQADRGCCLFPGQIARRSIIPRAELADR